ncbi:MAG TPA: hypothetical protein VFW19_08780 [Allosphingosinicella sp.]|nr:hypothetical protein [Allosphingosinicella sp.]
MKRRIGVSIFALLAAAAAPAPRPVYRVNPVPGVRHYLYEVIETINGVRRDGWRTEFDLISAHGTIDAVVRKTFHFTDKGWDPVTADPACRAAMHGNAESLARVRLWPMPPDSAPKLGASFLDTCAPAGVFFPLTDILNVAVIPWSPTFHAQDLREVGQSVHYEGFEAAFDRAGEAIKETAHGGEVRLAALDPHRAVIDWRPDPADLEMNESAQKPPMTLKGTEHWAFRLELDRASGTILRAQTTYDDLDLAIVGAPPNVPRVKITRAVLIESR